MKHILPTLYKVDTKGKMREWTITVSDDSGTPQYTQKHGVVDGKLQTTTTTIAKGKNIGRANETTPLKQCQLEATSLWNKKKDRNGYFRTRAEARAIPSLNNGTIMSSGKVIAPQPMLAKSYNVPGPDLAVLKDGKKITYPCFAQPKLDGIRCVAVVTSEGVKLFSRQQKEWSSLQHIAEAVEKLNLPTGTVLDGELYVHGEEFQSLTSAIKRDDASEDTANIEYHVYDMVSDDDYTKRLEFLQEYITNNLGLIQLVRAETVTNQDEMIALHTRATKNGYEGIMLRNKEGGYKVGGRSKDLQKVKKFIDMEFEIVDAYENKGKQAGQCTLVCVTAAGATFGVKPQGSEKVRRQYWTDWKAGKLKGEMLTVRFFSWTTSNQPVPRFPVGVAVRDYED